MHTLLKQRNNASVYKLGDLAEIRRGSSPRPIHEFITKSGMPWVKIADVTNINSRFVNSTKEFIREEGIRNSVVVNPGDLILSNSATPGVPKFLGITACIHDGWLLLKPHEEMLDKNYLYYVLLHIRPSLLNAANGAVFDNLKTDILKDFRIRIPNLESQKKIAEILSSYDEKIELNNKIQEKLERLAHLLFQEWFIKLQFPGYESVKFIEAESTKLPTGWQIKKLGEVIDLAYGKALKAEDREEGPYPVVGSSGIVGSHSKAFVRGPGIVVGRKGNAGSLIWIDQDFYPIDTTFYVVTELDLYFCFLMLKNQTFQSGDSAVPGLNREVAYKNDTLVPPMNLQKQFGSVVSSMFKKIREVQSENEKLSRMRNFLIAELMTKE